MKQRLAMTLEDPLDHATRVVGLVGRMKSGKDTLAEFIKENATGSVKIIHMADTLKEIGLLFGFTKEQLNDQSLKEVVDPYWGVTPRYFLQLVGTEMFRNLFRQDVWTKLLERRIRANEDNVDLYIIADIRFPNEARMVQDLGGTVIRVFRDTVEKKFHHDLKQARFTTFCSKIPLLNKPILWILKKCGMYHAPIHASEALMDEIEFDLDVQNNRSLSDLKRIAQALISDIECGVFDLPRFDDKK